MSDFIVINVPAMLGVKVTISDEAGERPDPGWNREAAESQFVMAELLAEQGLLVSSARVARRPDLVINWSDLTPRGQRFVKAHYHKWLGTIDRTGMTEEVKRKKLERRWRAFAVEAS